MIDKIRTIMLTVFDALVQKKSGRRYGLTPSARLKSSFRTTFLLIQHRFYLTAPHTTAPLIAAVTGIAIIVKVRQNFELRAYLADKSDCVL